MPDNVLNTMKRGSFSGGGKNDGPKETVIAKVEHIKDAPDSKDRLIKARQADGNSRDNAMAIYAPLEVARKMIPGKTYEIELDHNAFRGGGRSCFAGKETRRMSGKPVEVSSLGGQGGGGKKDRFRTTDM